MIKSTISSLVSAFRWIMDPRVSPLRHLTPAQRFQVTAVLGMMWTTIFCLGTSAWLYYGELMAFHLLLAFGALATGLTFRSAAKQAKTHRDYPREDGTARYDDVWGA
jgi:hypothetical protein